MNVESTDTLAGVRSLPTKSPDVVNGFGFSLEQDRVSFRDKVKDNWYKVKYGGLHLISSSCDCYGHLGRDCKVLSSHGTMSAKGMVIDELRATTTRGDMNSSNGSIVQVVYPGIETKIDGDWLIVTKVRKPKNSKEQN
ncbi:hypothetical protein NC653_003805 [Populus alba x Populus x berolinensis]|uniref:Uncharacterized protein n=1 Tax=Populus alba x Populus x berolinensis TaxID=444605 RepID=A0AAD6RT93_9ROSI|nr:hypothetical protein NC653_003805 [Populus alba x Populus x berolinensis]